RSRGPPSGSPHPHARPRRRRGRLPRTGRGQADAPRRPRRRPPSGWAPPLPLSSREGEAASPLSMFPPAATAFLRGGEPWGGGERRGGGGAGRGARKACRKSRDNPPPKPCKNGEKGVPRSPPAGHHRLVTLLARLSLAAAAAALLIVAAASQGAPLRSGL